MSAAVVLSLLAIVVLTTPAFAGRSWCSRDPIIKVRGTHLQILIAVPAEYEAAVNGPVRVKIKTPKGVSRELVFADSGFNGYGEEVIFEDSPAGAGNKQNTTQTQIEVSVPINQSMIGDRTQVQMQLTITPEHGKQVVKYGNARGTGAGLNVESSTN
jgi:hypothetical protein